MRTIEEPHDGAGEEGVDDDHEHHHCEKTRRDDAIRCEREKRH